MAKTVIKRVRLDSANCKWFEETYPNGSFSWLFDMLLAAFKDKHEVTPAELASAAAERVMEER